MNRNEFLEHLDQGSNLRHLFTPEEFGYPVLFVYGNIHAAVRDYCKTIQVTSHSVSRLQCAFETRPFATMSLDLRPYFEIVLDRDPVVRSYLRLVTVTPDSTQYQIELGSDE